MNKYLPVGLVAILVIAGGWWYFGQQKDTEIIASNDSELCQKNVELSFTPNVALTDSHTKTRFTAPNNASKITNSEKCPRQDTYQTSISLNGDRAIYITAAPEDDLFEEWNAGVPITELETRSIRIAGTDITAKVYDVEEQINGEWQPYGQPFMVVFVDRNGLHYMFQLPYDTEALKQLSLTFLSSLTFVQ